MMNRRFKNGLSVSRDAHAAVPQQMTLFPEEKPGRDLERMKIKTLLNAFYKTADSHVTGRKIG